MAEIIVAQRMWQRRDTAAAWVAANPVLADGEIGVERGATSADPQRFKIGNGVSTWTQLAYFGAGGGSAWYTGTTPPGSGVGEVGDYYLNGTTGDVHQKTAATTWTYRANLKGPQGANGAKGADGSNGQNPEFRFGTTHFQYRLIGSSTWIDLYPLSAMTGPPGEPGTDGVDAPTVARTTITVSSPTGSVVSSTVAAPRMSRLFHCVGTGPFRLRLYATQAERDADYARPAGTDAPLGSGLMFEFIGIASMLGASLQPVPTIFNNENPPLPEVAYILEPTSSVLVTVTLSIMEIQP